MSSHRIKQLKLMSTSSSASSSKFSSQTAAMKEINMSLSTNSCHLFRFRSLSSLASTIAIAILQMYLISNRLRLLKELRAESVGSPDRVYISPIATDDQKLTNSLIINAFLVAFAAIFTLLHLLVNPLRLGILSHDNFKLGVNFRNARRKSKHENNATTPMPEASCMRRFFCLNSIECFKFRQPKFWMELPPLGACFHLVSALFLLVAEVQISSKRIQLSQKPIGDIFSTKLDFLLGEPIYRLQNAFKSSKDSATSNTNILNDIMQAKDDFSVFNTESDSLNSLTHAITSNAINLDYLNYLIALHVFAVKVAQTFWHASRRFSLLTYVYALTGAILMSVSYCSFEVLFKANNLQKIAKQLLYMRATSAPNTIDKKIESTINMIEDYGHDLVSTILFLLSSFILFLNCYFVAKYGYKCYSKVSSWLKLI